MTVAAATTVGLGPGVYTDVSHADYHADPAATPSLSSSLAKVLLGQSPLHAWHQHPRLGGKPSTENSDAMDRGSIIHALILGKGAGFARLDYADWRTKESRERRDEARASGQVPILADRLDECEKVARLLGERLPDLSAYATEATLVWESEGFGISALCRGRIDAWNGPQAHILDLKATDDVRRASQPRNVEANGLHLSVGAYYDAVETLYPDLAGRVTFSWWFAEMGEPYDVVEAFPSGELLELGRKQWRRAVDRWARCLADDSWPGVADGKRMRVEAPPWAMANDLEEELKKQGSNDVESL